MGGAGGRSAPARRHAPHLRRADAGHRVRALLLDLHQPFTVALFVAGHFSADLQRVTVESPVAGAVANGLYHVLPDFALFDVKAAVVHGAPIPASRAALAVGYAALYGGGLLACAVLIFSRRDFR